MIEPTQKLCDFVAALAEEFGVNLDENVTPENVDSILKSYDFQAGAYMNHVFLNLDSVVRVAYSIGILDDGEY